MDKEFLDELKLLENEINYDLYITSGYRCDTHNSEVGGVIDSRHLDGLAVDIRIHNSDNINEMKNLAQKTNYFTRVIDEGDHIHLSSGDDSFAFKVLYDSDKYYYKDLSLSNSLYFSGGYKNNTSNFYRIGYFITDGCDLDNFYLYYENLKKNNSELINNQYAIGGSWAIYLDGPYWGIDLSAGAGTFNKIDYTFFEPNINVGYIFQYIDLQLNLGYTIQKPSNFNTSKENNISGFNIDIISSFGIFKS